MQQDLVIKAAGLRALKGEHYPPHRQRGTPKKQRVPRVYWKALKKLSGGGRRSQLLTHRK